MEWISVKDSMPKTEFIEYIGNISGNVLIKVLNDNEVRMGWWNLDKRKWKDASDLACCGCPDMQYEFEQVTHWMPLPELPKE
jgi:hypothetical protein